MGPYPQNSSMGAYLAKPDTEKESSSGVSKQQHIKFGHSSMQGWRVNMEDAYLAVPNLSSMSELSVFGVFDGHGGEEVAQYAGQKLPEMISKLVKSKKDQIEKAINDYEKNPDACKKLLASLLDEVVMELDSKIINKKGQKELKAINMANDSDDNDGDKEDRREELKDLCEEAELTIEELRAKYGNPVMSGGAEKVDEGASGSKKSTKKVEENSEKSESNGIQKEILSEKLDQDYTNDSSDTEESSESGSGSEDDDSGSDSEDESDEELREL